MIRITQLTLIFLLLFGCSTSQQPDTSNLPEKPSDPGFVYGDALPDAPELAYRGNYSIGVRTITVTNEGQLDILNRKDGTAPTYDRNLALEIWYPATVPDGQAELENYTSVIGLKSDSLRPLKPFQFKGRCLRDAEPLKEDAAFPLIILSHGYPGTRLLFTYLSENLASKGYVVVSIDHTESTYEDVDAFSSTLLNRSLDQLFVLNEIDRLSKDSGSFLYNLVDATNTGIAGYSMGGYGVLNTAGAGYSPAALAFFQSRTEGSDALKIRTTGNSEYVNSLDDRIKAVVAFAPWGMNYGVWDAEGLKGLELPTLFIAGSQDDISGYENGVKAIFDGVINSDRYMLTYMNARHNVSPNPAPPESMKEGLNLDEYLRYADSVWDMRRINNINQHFVTAFFGIHLKGLDYGKYFEVSENANDEVWTGFKPRTAVGLELRHKLP